MPRPPPQKRSSVSDWSDAIERMSARGAGPKAIYDTLRLEHAGFDGSYDAVKRLCKSIADQQAPKAEDVVIPVSTGPGEVAQVDYFHVGKIYDPAEGRDRTCWAFVMLLGHSRHAFVDLAFDQRAETWARMHAAAFSWFGGVPAVVVPDNLKTAVIRAAFNSSGEVALNRSYVALARHYGFQVDPTPPRAPTKKGKVERFGRYFRNSYIKPRVFADIRDARAGIPRWVREVAGARIHGSTGRRPLESFERDEQAAMQPLPTMPFVPVVWHQAKVHSDGYVQFRRHLYTVPWQLVGQQLWLRATPESVVAMADDERVATHRRTDGYGRTTNLAHRPPKREQWSRRERPFWEEKAAALGPEVHTYVCELFDADDVLLQLRKVQAIVTFLEDMPAERREAACRRARFYGVTGVRAFKDILRKGLDLEALPADLTPAHGVLATPRFARGAAAFQPTTTPEA